MNSWELYSLLSTSWLRSLSKWFTFVEYVMKLRSCSLYNRYSPFQERVGVRRRALFTSTMLDLICVGSLANLSEHTLTILFRCGGKDLCVGFSGVSMVVDLQFNLALKFLPKYRAHDNG